MPLLIIKICGKATPLSVEANTLLAHKMPHKKGSAHKKSTNIMPISRSWQNLCIMYLLMILLIFYEGTTIVLKLRRHDSPIYQQRYDTATRTGSSRQFKWYRHHNLCLSFKSASLELGYTRISFYTKLRVANLKLKYWLWSIIWIILTSPFLCASWSLCRLNYCHLSYNKRTRFLIWAWECF